MHSQGQLHGKVRLGCGQFSERPLLGDMGGGRGMTEPYSGEVVFVMGAPAYASAPQLGWLDWGATMLLALPPTVDWMVD